MMRHYQMRSQRKARRKAISESNEGIFSWIRIYNRSLMGLILCSLTLSIVLIFIGTYVCFDANISHTNQSFAAHESMPKLTRSTLYDGILYLYGINETNFSMLYSTSTSQSEHNNFQLTNYRIGLSMMLVGGCSMLLEIGLICSILLEHFKFSLLCTSIMAVGLVHSLAYNSAHIYLHSLAYQLFVLVAFGIFSASIKIKSFRANQILRHRINSTSSDQHREQLCLSEKA